MGDAYRYGGKLDNNEGLAIRWFGQHGGQLPITAISVVIKSTIGKERGTRGSRKITQEEGKQRY
jgi:hypothetical protein